MGENGKMAGNFQSEEKGMVALIYIAGTGGSNIGSDFRALLSGFCCCISQVKCCPTWMKLAKSFCERIVLSVPKGVGGPKSS